MTTLLEAAEIALNALDSINTPLQVRDIDKVGNAMNALRTALEQKASIRLISAAPDLLNVLREVRAIWSEDEFQLGTVDRIHSAIAKATGEQMTALREAALDEPCFCDRNGIGASGVSCGDCPTRDYKNTGR
jgi:hypothetical protein